MCAVLLKAGCDVNAQTRWSETPLHYAVRNGKLASVKQLVAAGADINIETVSGDSALVLARKYMKPEIVAYLSEL